MKGPRDAHLDALKGLGILLVVFGHALQGTGPDFDRLLAFRLIYSFHMPLFMFISGWLTRPFELGALGDKAQRLVLPFLCWYALGFLTTDLAAAAYFGRLWRQVDWGLWFFWVLFLCYGLGWLAFKLERHLGAWAFLLLGLVLYQIRTGVLGLDLLRWQFPFFAAGILAARRHEWLARYRWTLTALALTVFVLAFNVWGRGLDAPERLPLRHWVDARPWINVDHVLRAQDYLVAFAGIALVWSLVAAWRSLQRALAPLGALTFGIYAVHFQLLGHGFGSGIWALLSSALIALGGSILIVLALERIPYLRVCLLGQRSQLGA